MRLPFHALRIATPCLTPSFSQCLDNALNNPPISAVPVDDIIGVPYAYDIVINDGIYLIVMFFIFRNMWFRFLRYAFLKK